MLRKRKFWIRLLIFSGLLIFANIVLIYFANSRIDSYGKSFVYDSLDKIPKNKVGVILGTSKKLADGRQNLYFRFRIEAAVRLYNAGKIKYILVSGDNGLKYYNEPMDMKKALVEQGIPKEVIYLDYAGFRTLDSVIRCHKVFGQNSFTIISQEFHNKRAIYIGKSYDLDVIGFNARDVIGSSALKTQLREKLARVKVFIDLYILNTKPKYLGKKEKIG